VPFDGVVTKCIISELKKELIGGRIEKVFQPQHDEIILNVHSLSGSKKLLLCANASNPRIHFINSGRANPGKPPMFCMLLRKHLNFGVFKDFMFHDYERMVDIHIETLNEMGDTVQKRLIIEIMGRYSNIILVNENNVIIDCIKHVDNEISRVREIMPGRPYLLPPSQDKASPEAIDAFQLLSSLKDSRMRIEKCLLERIKGFSPYLCKMICYSAGIEDNPPAQNLTDSEITSLGKELSHITDTLKDNRFKPYLLFMDGVSDYHCIPFKDHMRLEYFNSISDALDQYYYVKGVSSGLAQRKAAILKKLNAALKKCERKLFLQQSDIEASSNMDELKLFGELITANIHNIPERAKSVKLLDYYSENERYVVIPIDENLTPQKNAQNYFKKYNKAKSTYMHASENLKITLEEISYLETLIYHAENCESMEELDEMMGELVSSGYIYKDRRKSGNKKGSSENSESALPLHYVSSDGVDIYVGRNNRQNDLLTLKHAAKEDLWLHAQKIPGSHVIIHGKGKIPDRTIMEAAEIAAFHSKYSQSANVPVDITKVKNVRKPKGFKPGLVLYDDFRTVYVTPRKEVVSKLKS
jgi:predicted ribosome quality control (RQC) complex YloA/Tae2 family protein